MNFYLPRKLMVESAKKLKDLFDMNKWYKFMADMLHIPYTDVCCDINKNFTPVRYNIADDVHEWYNLAEDEWQEFGTPGTGGSIINDGEGTTLTGQNMDWGGIITHDATIDSDGVLPLPSILWGATNPMYNIEMNSTRTITLNSNDIFVNAADSFDVESTNVGFDQADQFNIDADTINMRVISDAHITDSGVYGLHVWHTHAHQLGGDVGFIADPLDGVYAVGDRNSVDNGTVLIVDDTRSTIKVTNIQAFADNAAALVSGLLAGELYRTGDALKIVH